MLLKSSAARLPVGSTQDEDTRKIKDFAYRVASAAVPSALLPKQVETGTADDLTSTQSCDDR